MLARELQEEGYARSRGRCHRQGGVRHRQAVESGHGVRRRHHPHRHHHHRAVEEGRRHEHPEPARRKIGQSLRAQQARTAGQEERQKDRHEAPKGVEGRGIVAAAKKVEGNPERPARLQVRETRLQCTNQGRRWAGRQQLQTNSKLGPETMARLMPPGKQKEAN